MRAPVFDDSRFAVLSKDLKGPLAWLRKQSILKRIRDAEDQIENVSTTMLSGDGLLDKILKDIDIASNAGFESSRPRRLADLAKKFADLQQKKALRYPVQTNDVIMQIRALYAIVDTDQLKADFASEFAGVPTFDPHQTIVDLDTQIDLAKSELLRAWPQKPEDFGPFFQSGMIPSHWEGRRVAPPGDPKRASQAASLVEAIMSDFFGVWRARQSDFQQKVTLGGILIHTLPDDIRPAWEALFAAARMKTGRPVYQPIIHDSFATRNKSKPENKMFDRSE